MQSASLEKLNSQFQGYLGKGTRIPRNVFNRTSNKVQNRITKCRIESKKEQIGSCCVVQLETSATPLLPCRASQRQNDRNGLITLLCLALLSTPSDFRTAVSQAWFTQAIFTGKYFLCELAYQRIKWCSSIAIKLLKSNQHSTVHLLRSTLSLCDDLNSTVVCEVFGGTNVFCHSPVRHSPSATVLLWFQLFRCRHCSRCCNEKSKYME